MRFVPALTLAVVCGACRPAPSSPFPEGFFWGSAIAGFQVDMGCPKLAREACEDRASDWYTFITTDALPDTDGYVKRQPPTYGPGHWELYDSDYALAKDTLGLNALRFSFEWSRIFPRSTEGVEGFDALRALANTEALTTYHSMLASLRARGLSPLVTLNHYTLPTWIHDTVTCHKDFAQCTKRGWVDGERIVGEISKYAAFVAREFGSEVDRYATLNEPFAVVLPGYLFPSAERANPPALLLRYDAAKTVMRSMVEAHARMYDAVKANDTQDADGDGVVAQVGLVYNVTPARPKDANNTLDVRGAKNLFYLYNTAFLDAVCLGQLDETLSDKPTFREELANRMDYLGVNYYTRVTVKGTDSPQFPALSPKTTFDALSLSVWEDFPRGLYDVTQHVKERYQLPIFITENGVPDPKDDGTASRFLARNVQWLERSAQDGADIRGYFWWSLMDNYEWNHGMDMRFGLFAVDPLDSLKTRVPRQTVSTYQNVISAGRVPPELAAPYAITE